MGALLHLNMDNTTAENKNLMMLAFLVWLVATGRFRSARGFFLPKGHTHTWLDQSFGTLIAALCQMTIYCVSELLRAILAIYASGKVYPIRDVVELHTVFDWTTFLSPYAERISRFATTAFDSGYHLFEVSATSDGRVVLHMRSSSQSVTWVPEGEGIELLIDVPLGSPPLAPLKADLAWKRASVERGVMQYFSLFQGENAELAAREWRLRFAQQPQDGDMSRLPDGWSLQFTHLPPTRITVRAPPSSVTPRSSAYDLVETPAVDSVIRPGRTEADVRKALLEYRKQLRLSPAVGEPTPIWPADYLLVRLPGSDEPTLVGVDRLTMGFFSSRRVVFIATQYRHLPPKGIAGLFGTFCVEKDGTGKPLTAALTRDSVLVYDATTFGTAGDLRLHPDTLTRLAAVDSRFVLPDTMPKSHCSQALQHYAEQQQRGSKRRKPTVAKPAATQRPAKPSEKNDSSEGGDSSAGGDSSDEGSDSSDEAAGSSDESSKGGEAIGASKMQLVDDDAYKEGRAYFINLMGEAEVSHWLHPIGCIWVQSIQYPDALEVDADPELEPTFTGCWLAPNADTRTRKRFHASKPTVFVKFYQAKPKSKRAKGKSRAGKDDTAPVWHSQSELALSSLLPIELPCQPEPQKEELSLPASFMLQVSALCESMDITNS